MDEGALHHYKCIKCGLKSPQMAKNKDFWYKFAPKGRVPLAILAKFVMDKGVLGPLSHAKFHHCGFSKLIWCYCPMNRKRNTCIFKKKLVSTATNWYVRSNLRDKFVFSQAYATSRHVLLDHLRLHV